jgi:hypothetical protein
VTESLRRRKWLGPVNSPRSSPRLPPPWVSAVAWKYHPFTPANAPKSMSMVPRTRFQHANCPSAGSRNPRGCRLYRKNQTSRRALAGVFAFRPSRRGGTLGCQGSLIIAAGSPTILKYRIRTFADHPTPSPTRVRSGVAVVGARHPAGLLPQPP